MRNSDVTFLDVNSAPYSAEKINNRAAMIGRPGEPITDRIKFLRQRAAQKKVLDVGVVEHSHLAAQQGNWLHRHIAEASGYCLGIDILADDIERLRGDGHNIILHDLCQGPLDENFDLIIMGELIEHIDNPFSLLYNAAKSLSKDGEIILTTPNPWYINYIKIALNKGFALDNIDHVCWFDPSTMAALAERAGLVLTGYNGLAGINAQTVKGKIAARVINAFASNSIFPLLNCKSILYVLKKSI